MRRSTRKRKKTEIFIPTWTVSGKKRRIDETNVLRTAGGKRSAGAGTNVKREVGVVDEAACSEGITYFTGQGMESVVYDVKLVLVNHQMDIDKFFVLQVILEDCSNRSFVVLQRWGRTGTKGNAVRQKVECETDAVTFFKLKFKEKTGLAWEERAKKGMRGKYCLVKRNHEEKSRTLRGDGGTWQYWVDDGVDGKEMGWYNYDKLGNEMVEQLYLEFRNNPWLIRRIVQSGTCSYLVDLQSMTQTNIVHPKRTVRQIRRVPPGEQPDNEDPIDDYPITFFAATGALTIDAAKPNVMSVEAKPPHKVQPVAAAAVYAKVKKGPKEPPKEQMKIDETVVPIDDMCPNADEYSVVNDFDAILSRSNNTKGNNKNKYYKIQMLLHNQKGTFHVWTR